MVFDFLTLPVTLALLTGAYNLVRFHSMTDFGYFHIPEVRDEPWYATRAVFGPLDSVERQQNVIRRFPRRPQLSVP